MAPDELDLLDAEDLYTWYRGQPVPDLKRISPERWEAALRPLSAWARKIACGNLGGLAEMHIAQRIALDLDGEDLERRRRALELSAPPPAPSVERPVARRRTQQVNFRVSPAEYRDLSRVALSYGATCSGLARMLTIRGVRRALADP